MLYPMLKSICFVNSLGQMSINQAAIHFNLPYSSLYGRFKRGKYDISIDGITGVDQSPDNSVSLTKYISYKFSSNSSSLILPVPVQSRCEQLPVAHFRWRRSHPARPARSHSDRSPPLGHPIDYRIIAFERRPTTSDAPPHRVRRRFASNTNCRGNPSAPSHLSDSENGTELNAKQTTTIQTQLLNSTKITTKTTKDRANI